MESHRCFVSEESFLIGMQSFQSIRITEAQNECRDKTKFLESIRRYLESLTEDAHPQNCAVNILPALCDAMRTVESVSRYYARQGYLGLIFSKVTNQLVKICKNHIDEDLTQLWPKLFEEIQQGSIDDIKENFHLDKRVELNDETSSWILLHLNLGCQTFSRSSERIGTGGDECSW